MFKKDPLQIIVFQTYGTPNHLYLRGRAIQDETINLEQKGAFKLLFNTWKRFETDEVKNTLIQIKLSDDIVLYSQTDTRGYFLIDQKVENLNHHIDEKGWIQLTFSYASQKLKSPIQSKNIFLGDMLIPSQNAKFAIVSDIDDTILHTGLASVLKWRVLYNTFLTSAGKRTPLDGASHFYNLLHQGKTGNEFNPVFYVSHSPWNLYRYLEYFLNKNNFPKGPIILRDFPKPFTKKGMGQMSQKHKEIIGLLNTYEKLKFILIGDCGEHDPYIYMSLANNYKDKIHTIYLVTVNHRRKMLRVKMLYDNYKTIPVMLVSNTKEAIKHAQEQGFIK